MHTELLEIPRQRSRAIRGRVSGRAHQGGVLWLDGSPTPGGRPEAIFIPAESPEVARSVDRPDASHQSSPRTQPPSGAVDGATGVSSCAQTLPPSLPEALRVRDAACAGQVQASLTGQGRGGDTGSPSSR